MDLMVKETADTISRECELTVVIPCLDEAETLGSCLEKVQRFFRAYDVAGTIIVADNGSTDGSQAIAHRHGAQVIDVPTRGYGAALRAGIKAAQTPFVAMADGDDSYDFMGLMPFVEKLREGHDLVMGNRFHGGIGKGAMPPLHRFVGNPVLSLVGRIFYRTPIGDFHCGMRAFRKDSIDTLGLSSPGMEFASEMVVKARLAGLSIAEVPTTLSPDGRSRDPHLRSFRDGWRHLKFLLLFAPRWLFVYPALALLILGFGGLVALLPGYLSFGDVRFGINSFLFCGAALLIGAQLASFGVVAKIFGVREGYFQADDTTARIQRWLTIDKGCIAGGGLMVAGLIGAGIALVQWNSAGFGDMVPEQLLRVTIPAMLAFALGIQIIFTSFLVEFLVHPAKDEAR